MGISASPTHQRPAGNKIVSGPHIKHIRVRSRMATAHVLVAPQDINTWEGGDCCSSLLLLIKPALFF